MGSRKAAAISLAVLSVAFRIAGILMAALTVMLCFPGVSARLNLVGFVIDLSRSLPDPISGYGLVTSPFGGVFRLDFALVACFLLVLDYICQRASRALR